MLDVLSNFKMKLCRTPAVLRYFDVLTIRNQVTKIIYRDILKMSDKTDFEQKLFFVFTNLTISLKYEDMSPCGMFLSFATL